MLRVCGLIWLSTGDLIGRLTGVLLTSFFYRHNVKLLGTETMSNNDGCAGLSLALLILFFGPALLFGTIGILAPIFFLLIVTCLILVICSILGG